MIVMSPGVDLSALVLVPAMFRECLIRSSGGPLAGLSLVAQAPSIDASVGASSARAHDPHVPR